MNKCIAETGNKPKNQNSKMYKKMLVPKDKGSPVFWLCTYWNDKEPLIELLESIKQNIVNTNTIIDVAIIILFLFIESKLNTPNYI